MKNTKKKKAGENFCDVQLRKECSDKTPKALHVEGKNW